MKLRALGCGSATCRHPLVPSSFLLQSEKSNVVFGCSAQTPAKLEAIGVDLAKIDIWAPLSARPEQILGLHEVALRVARGELPKPYLVGPEYLLKAVGLALVLPLSRGFNVIHTRSIHVNEEHLEEKIEFIPNYLGEFDRCGLVFNTAEIFITGEVELNEDWVNYHGAAARIILQACRFEAPVIEGYPQAPRLDELQTLPVYLQKKIWLYGYSNSYQEVEDPLPMIFLPQGQWIYDSDRKSKHLEKERFIRENSKRHLGNLAARVTE